MSFLTSLAAAFKGGGGTAPLPIGRGFASPWISAGATPYNNPSPRLPAFDYGSAVREAFLANPVAQRSVRIVAEGVGGAPLAGGGPALVKLLRGPAGTVPLLEVLASQLVLHGNAFVQIVKGSPRTPGGLFPRLCREDIRDGDASRTIRIGMQE